MPPNRTSRPNRALIDEFCSITGANKSLAGSLLEACGNNLEMAVNMHMEGVHGATESSSASTGASASGAVPVIDGEDEVRAPIPQKQEILVEGPDEIAYSFRGRRRIARSVFDKFRDFEAETKRQEAELLASANEDGGEGSAGASTSSGGFAGRKKKKMKTLEELFRPPYDLMYGGTFQAARDSGISSKRWLMVNIQNSSEFPCQVLNRDVWSNPAVKTIVKEHFVFWQVYHDSEEGQRFMMFYRVEEWPHVAVIDPRTGECLVTWHKLDAVTFCDLITEFLSRHPGLDESTPSPEKKRPRLEKDTSILEADEESQLEAAIKASLAEAEEKKDRVTAAATQDTDEEEEEDPDTLETFESDSEDVDYSLKDIQPTQKESLKRTFNGEAKIIRKISSSIGDSSTNSSESIASGENSCEAENSSGSEDDWKMYLGPETDPISKLMLRLPDGSRDIISMPSSSKLMALIKYVGSKGYSNEQYELVTNFPRREISYMDFNITLKAAGLFPQEAVFIQSR